MKVLNLRCANGHGFEGWFASDDDYMEQNGRAAIECPLCADKLISRLPSAPRLNLSGAREPRPAAEPKKSSTTPLQTPAQAQAQPQSRAEAMPTDLQANWLRSVHELIAKTEDVGERFATEARRIHYGETPHRAIRGQASIEERAALQDEGIETMSVAIPAALKGPVQ